MAGTCGASIVKFGLIIVNLALLLVGALCSYVGVKLVGFEDGKAFELADIDFKSISWVVLAVGLFILLVAALGFFGTCCNSSALLNLYGFLLILLIAAQIYIVVREVKSNKNIKDEIGKKITEAIQQMSNNTDTLKILQEIQKELKCCGWNNYSDYKNNSDNKVPASCCDEWKITDNPDKTCQINDDVKNKPGCESKFNDLEQYLGNSKTVGIIAILVQIILALAAFCIARDI